MELENYSPDLPIYLPYLIYIPSDSLCWNLNLSIDTIVLVSRNENHYASAFGGHRNYAESMILSRWEYHTLSGYVTVVATRKTTIGNHQYRQLTTLVNSTSTLPPIGLLPKGAKFCHTSNILLVGCWCCRAWSRLYLYSSAAGWLLIVGQLSVGPQLGLPGFRRFPSKRINTRVYIRLRAVLRILLALHDKVWSEKVQTYLSIRQS